MRGPRSPRQPKVVGGLSDTHGLIRPQALAALADTAAVQVDKARLYVLHDLHDLDLDPAAAGFAAVIAGHSHRPGITQRDGVLYVNPGSAGPRRFHLPVAVARLCLRGVKVSGEVVLLHV
jgi:predicted phosphodiesterase